MSKQLLKAKGRELNAAIGSYQNLKRTEKLSKNAEAATSKAARKEEDSLKSALETSSGAESFDLNFEGESQVELTSPDGTEAFEVSLPEATDMARLRDEFLTGIVYDPNFTLQEEDDYYTQLNDALADPHSSFSGATFFTDEDGVILIDDGSGSGLGEEDLDWPQETWECFKWICTFYLAYLSGKQTNVSLGRILKGVPSEQVSEIAEKILELPYHSQVSGDDVCAVGGEAYRSQEVALDTETEEGRRILRKRLNQRVRDPNERERLLSHVDILDPEVEILLPDGTRDVTCLSENLTRQQRNTMLEELREAVNPSVDTTTPEGREKAVERLQGLGENYDEDSAEELVERIQKLRTTEDPIQETESIAVSSLSDWGVTVDIDGFLESLEEFVDQVAQNHPRSKNEVYSLMKLWFKREMPQDQFDEHALTLFRTCCTPVGRASFDRLQSLGERIIFLTPRDDDDWTSIWNQIDGILTTHFSGTQLDDIRSMIRVLLPANKPDFMMDIAGNLEVSFEAILDAEVADPHTPLVQEDKDRALKAFQVLRHESRTQEEVQEYKATLNAVLKKFRKGPRFDQYREHCHVLAGSSFLFEPYLESVLTRLADFHIAQITNAADRQRVAGLILFLHRGELTDFLKDDWNQEIFDLYGSTNYQGHIDGLFDRDARSYLHLGALTFHLIHKLSLDEYALTALPERLIAAVAEVTNLGVTDSRETDLDNEVVLVSGGMLDPADAVSAYFELKGGRVASSTLDNIDTDVQALVPDLLTEWTDLKALFLSAFNSAESQADNPDTRRIAPATVGGAAQTYMAQVLAIEASFKQTVSGNTPAFRTTRRPSDAVQAPEIFSGSELDLGSSFPQTQSYQVIRDPKYKLVGGDEFFRRIRTFANRDSKVAREGNRITQKINKFRTQTTGRLLTKTQDFRAESFRIQQDVLNRMSEGVGDVTDAVASVLCLMDGLHDLIKVMNGAVSDLAGIGRDILRSASGLVDDIRNSLKAVKQTLLTLLRTMATLMRTQIGINCACMSVNFGLDLDLGFFGLGGIPNWIAGAFPNVPNPFAHLGDLLNDFQDLLTLDPKLGCPQNIVGNFGGDSAISSAADSVFG